jgi:hypothetical protein
VGAVIGSGISGVDAEPDEPTCTAVADLIVDELAIAVGAVTHPAAIPPVAHLRHLTDQTARQTLTSARFTEFNCAPGRPTHAVGKALTPPDHIPVINVDGRDRHSANAALIAVTEYSLSTLTPLRG